MEQRDYLERQIEALGKVLQAMAQWLATGRLPKDSLVLKQQIQTKLDLPFDPLDPAALKGLAEQPGWNEENRIALVKCYLDLADQAEAATALLALDCAEQVLNELLEEAETFRFEWSELVSLIKESRARINHH